MIGVGARWGARLLLREKSQLWILGLCIAIAPTIVFSSIVTDAMSRPSVLQYEAIAFPKGTVGSLKLGFLDNTVSPMEQRDFIKSSTQEVESLAGRTVVVESVRQLQVASSGKFLTSAAVARDWNMVENISAAFEVVDGRLPRSPSELSISQHAAALLDVAVGQLLNVESRQFRVVGILSRQLDLKRDEIYLPPDALDTLGLVGIDTEWFITGSRNWVRLGSNREIAQKYILISREQKLSSLRGSTSGLPWPLLGTSAVILLTTVILTARIDEQRRRRRRALFDSLSTSRRARVGVSLGTAGTSAMLGTATASVVSLFVWIALRQSIVQTGTRQPPNISLPYLPCLLALVAATLLAAVGLSVGERQSKIAQHTSVVTSTESGLKALQQAIRADLAFRNNRYISIGQIFSLACAVLLLTAVDTQHVYDLTPRPGQLAFGQVRILSESPNGPQNSDGNPLEFAPGLVRELDRFSDEPFIKVDQLRLTGSSSSGASQRLVFFLSDDFSGNAVILNRAAEVELLLGKPLTAAQTTAFNDGNLIFLGPASLASKPAQVASLGSDFKVKTLAQTFKAFADPAAEPAIQGQMFVAGPRFFEQYRSEMSWVRTPSSLLSPVDSFSRPESLQQLNATLAKYKIPTTNVVKFREPLIPDVGVRTLGYIGSATAVSLLLVNATNQFNNSRRRRQVLRSLDVSEQRIYLITHVPVLMNQLRDWNLGMLVGIGGAYLLLPTLFANTTIQMASAAITSACAAIFLIALNVLLLRKRDS